LGEKILNEITNWIDIL